ncbi:MAG: transglutaminase domain-containing protein, partial [Methanosarcinaceae archaeon]
GSAPRLLGLDVDKNIVYKKVVTVDAFGYSVSVSYPEKYKFKVSFTAVDGGGLSSIDVSIVGGTSTDRSLDGETTYAYSGCVYKPYLDWDLVQGWEIDIEVADVYDNVNHTDYHVNTELQDWVDRAEELGDDWQEGAQVLAEEVAEGMLEGAYWRLKAEALSGVPEAERLMTYLENHVVYLRDPETDHQAEVLHSIFNDIYPENPLLKAIEMGETILYGAYNIFIVTIVIIILFILILIVALLLTGCMEQTTVEEPHVLYDNSYNTKKYYCWQNEDNQLLTYDEIVARRGTTIAVYGDSSRTSLSITPTDLKYTATAYGWDLEVTDSIIVHSYNLEFSNSKMTLHAIFDPLASGLKQESEDFVKWYGYHPWGNRDTLAYWDISNDDHRYNLNPYCKTIVSIAMGRITHGSLRTVAEVAGSFQGYSTLLIKGVWGSEDRQRLYDQGDDIGILLKDCTYGSKNVFSGECMDFAAVQISLDRSVGIPARVIYGKDYQKSGEGIDGDYDFHWLSFHVWTEVWDGKWYVYDPTDASDNDGDKNHGTGSGFSRLLPKDYYQGSYIGANSYVPKNIYRFDNNGNGNQDVQSSYYS